MTDRCCLRLVIDRFDVMTRLNVDVVTFLEERRVAWCQFIELSDLTADEIGNPTTGIGDVLVPVVDRDL